MGAYEEQDGAALRVDGEEEEECVAEQQDAEQDAQVNHYTDASAWGRDIRATLSSPPYSPSVPCY